MRIRPGAKARVTSCASVNWSLTTVGHCTLPRRRRPLSSEAPRAPDALGAALRLRARQACNTWWRGVRCHGGS